MPVPNIHVLVPSVHVPVPNVHVSGAVLQYYN